MLRRLVALLPLAVTTCCPPEPAKPTPPVTTGSGSAGPAAPANGPVELGALTPGAKVHGFTTAAVFLDGADHPIGGRFVHDATGFTLDYLRVETAPQGMIWVNSFPTSDKGEPHTQEHLLLGKGDRGRRFGSSEAMALAQSSAFTAQWRTAYHFHTVAGNDVFWPVFENELDALINPDYTDEEIRREVRNFGVDRADDGTLRLEEKGTVYNEMVRSYENPAAELWRAASQLVYGATHPLALESGGYPDAIRTMTPDDIRRFHRDHYHLANMGMIGAFPSAMAVGDVLDQTAATLGKLAARKGPVKTEADLPPPAGAAPGTIRIVEFPYSDAVKPGPMLFAWPATRKLDASDRLLLALLLDAFAGDESTTLYKKLIDSKTRELDLGASQLWNHTTDDQGQPVFIGIEGVKADKLDDATVARVRDLIHAELARIAALPDGDPALLALRDRIKSRAIDLRRQLDKFLDTPPGFGIRGTETAWLDHLHGLMSEPGFQKSLTMRPALAKVDAVLAGTANPWRDRLRAWGLLDVPYGVAARPSPARRAALDAARAQRIVDELTRLEQQYGTSDVATTLARYQQDYDAATRKLEDAAHAAELPPLVASVPMTLDDNLKYEVGKRAGVPSFAASFASMASARVQLAFRIDGAVAPDRQFLLAALPALLADAGVIVDGTPIAADEMRERLRAEVLELSVDYAIGHRTGRHELVITGAGGTPTETRAALSWVRRVLEAPDWRVDNLPRLRDLVDQQLTMSRARMLGAEERWVEDPRDAWREQSELGAHVGSFLTQQHDLHRLRWRLLDPRDAKVTAEAVKFLRSLDAAARLPRAQLVELAQALARLDAKPARPRAARWFDAANRLSPPARAIARAAGKDLAAIVPELPDGSLAADWRYLAREMAADLGVGADRTLAMLGELRAQLVVAPRARLVEVGSPAHRAAVAGDVDALIGRLPTTAAPAIATPVGRPFEARLREHDRTATGAPLYVGLVAPATSSGVFVNTVTSTWFGDTSDDAVLDYLASNLYTGHGGHSMFMKTWAAGLAYSNGLRPHIERADLVYYAERVPLLPQTLRFVIDQLRKATPDASIARYAIAQAFGSRVAIRYEQRAAAMAADLADGQTPDVVRAFRTRVLEAAKRPDLAPALFGRMEAVYGKVLPGYGKPDPGATYFVIGPEKQLAAYDDYLRGAVGKGAKLHRLYPRDFWIPAKP